MSYPVVDCSPKARAKIVESTEGLPAPVEINTHHRTKYPIDQLHVGQSFTVPLAEANEASLRLTASKRGKDSKKRFCVIKHAEYACFEVARIG